MKAAELAPGIELDRLVLGQVFGVTWDACRCRVCGWPLVEDPAQGCTPDDCSMRPVPETRADTPARYSSVLAPAWSIVDNLRERGFAVALVSTKDGKWACDVALGDFSYVNPMRQEGETAPLAICRAALAALGRA